MVILSAGLPLWTAVSSVPGRWSLIDDIQACIELIERMVYECASGAFSTDWQEQK